MLKIYIDRINKFIPVEKSTDDQVISDENAAAWIGVVLTGNNVKLSARTVSASR